MRLTSEAGVAQHPAKPLVFAKGAHLHRVDVRPGRVTSKALLSRGRRTPALARFQQTPTAAPDESEKLDGLLLGQQSSHQRAAQLTAGLGVKRQRGRRSRPSLCCPGAPRPRTTRLPMQNASLHTGHASPGFGAKRVSDSAGSRDRIRLLTDARADDRNATVAIVASTAWS
jgi:hypothetical protein